MFHSPPFKLSWQGVIDSLSVPPWELRDPPKKNPLFPPPGHKFNDCLLIIGWDLAKICWSGIKMRNGMKKGRSRDIEMFWIFFFFFFQLRNECRRFSSHVFLSFFLLFLFYETEGMAHNAIRNAIKHGGLSEISELSGLATKCLREWRMSQDEAVISTNDDATACKR